jgi:Sap, sulfolipid-1-addressing protein
MDPGSTAGVLASSARLWQNRAIARAVTPGDDPGETASPPAASPPKRASEASAGRSRVSSVAITTALLGLGCAANPFGYTTAVLLLEAKRGHSIVWTFALSWTVAISVGLAVLVAGLGAVVDSGSHTASTSSSVAHLVLGLGLVAWGIERILQDRRAAAARGSTNAAVEAKTPGWMRAIENTSYVPAFLLGIYMATWPLVIAASGEIVSAGGSTAQTVALGILFVVLGASAVVAVAAIGTFAPDRSKPMLDRFRRWSAIHSRTLVTALLILIGLVLAGHGLSGLV